jgi:uncharacterized protein (UPF0333 family)
MDVKKMNRKAQVGMEYMILVGFLVVITIPLVLVYNSHYKSTSEQIISNQADQLGQKIIDTAESIYYLGEPSKTTIKIYVPQNIENLTIGNNEIVFGVNVGGGRDDVVKVSSVPITGFVSATPGLHTVEIKSHGSYVNISSD